MDLKYCWMYVLYAICTVVFSSNSDVDGAGSTVFLFGVCSCYCVRDRYIVSSRVHHHVEL